VIWLGEKRGFLSDWVTQRWVQTTGRRINLGEHCWLDGPTGNTKLIGKDFFTEYARRNDFKVVQTGIRGLVENFSALSGNSTDFSKVAAPVKDFYERTSEYSLDAWSEWHGFFRPFGRALAILFSRRLQQLNIPLSSLDSSKGMTSSVVQLRDHKTGELVQTAWIRELNATKNVLYAGSYSVCSVPGHPSPCIRVVFPLPNGSAIVVMRPEIHHDGSFSITSAGKSFGDPGFYFIVRGDDGMVWARYLRSMQEKIHVYPAESQTVRADHILWLYGKEFLRLHYRMRLQPTHHPAEILEPSAIT